ncbi:hypothetical protein [Catellatospora tritici]|uniref:hypothetical protein n=1 Tax=Catellatospora tritici TaxID=2851566 RepID=UPI001C2DEEA6|nr:hypothetical protein [Catellatospora tritici]MBV1856636.1 hypothetical protein [Catellatospora tritici]
MSRKTGKPPHNNPSARQSSSLTTAQVLRMLSALAVAAVVGAFIGVQITAPSAAETTVASLREQEARRDVAQISELTTRARATVTAIQPIVDGLTATAQTTDEQLAAWRQTLATEVAWYSKTVSGMTATNIARGALRGAVQQLALAADTAAAARALPASSRQPVLKLAERQRDLAAAAWSVAATQLDQINIDAGNGHQHVYLSPTGTGGEMTGDGQAEGTGS